MPKRNLYLNNTPLEEALEKFLSALDGKLVPACEKIPAREALDRITANAIHARRCSPLFNCAAMDGIAVVSDATAGAAETSPVTLFKNKDFTAVNTGDPVRQPFDAVIMAEDIQELDENTILIREAAASWQHIRPVGEDIVTGEMLIPGRRRIRPFDIGVLLSAGITEVEVFQRPKVAVFPTGNEIIEADQTPKEGEIIESNTRMLEALIREEGAEAGRFDIVSDDPALLENAVSAALAEYGMVLINAGSSAGTQDYTACVLEKMGKVIVHGVAIKPGKPVILAVVQGKPVFGIPGYPVSAYIAYRNLVSPVLAALSGRKSPELHITEAVMAKRLVSSLKHREYVRVKIGNVGGKLVAYPLARGAGAAMSLVRADGFCVIEQNSEGIEAGQKARIELFRPLNEIESALVSVGSHDLILDIIADLMNGTGFLFSGTHVGSMAGLMALKRGECHITPVHLLDEETHLYNIPYIKRLFPDTPVCLIKGVNRIQGLIVKKGNPLGIKSVKQLPGCRYINRQRGSGTRLFLDHELKKESLSPECITGYEREAVTHMAVAAAVQSADADAGMGIASAAAALDLDFIPLGEEEYDFALYPHTLELPQLKIFIETLKSEGFHKRILELNGYTAQKCGEISKIG